MLLHKVNQTGFQLFAKSKNEDMMTPGTSVSHKIPIVLDALDLCIPPTSVAVESLRRDAICQNCKMFKVAKTSMHFGISLIQRNVAQIPNRCAYIVPPIFSNDIFLGLTAVASDPGSSLPSYRGDHYISSYATSTSAAWRMNQLSVAQSCPNGHCAKNFHVLHDIPSYLIIIKTSETIAFNAGGLMALLFSSKQRGFQCLWTPHRFVITFPKCPIHRGKEKVVLYILYLTD